MMHLSNICVTWVPAREEKLVNEKQIVLIMIKNFPKLEKLINLQILEVLWISREKKSKESHALQILIKLLKSKDKEKFL